MGSDPEAAMTYEDLLGQLKRFGKFGFIWAPMMVQMMMADPSDIPDLDALSQEIADNKGNIDFVKGFAGDKQIAYETRLRQLLGDMIEYGYWN